MINILLGIIIWQLFFLVINCIWFIIRKILLVYDRKVYNLYAFYGEVGKSKMDNKADKWINNYYMKPKTASMLRQVGKNETPVNYSVRVLRDGKEFKSSIYRQEILKPKDIENGIPGMSKDFMSKFIK